MTDTTQHKTADQGLLTVDEAARLLSLSRSSLYKLLADGRVGSVTIGRSRRVLRSELDAFVSELVDKRN